MTGAKTAAKTAPLDMAAVLDLAKPREVIVRLCLAGDLAARADRLAADLDRMAFTPTSLAEADPRTAMAAELDDLIAQMKAAEVEFQFRAVSHQALSDLKAEEPPRNDDEAWNSDTLPVRLVAMSCVSPAMSLEQAQALFDIVNTQQRSELFTAAYQANHAATQIPISRAVSASLSSSDAR